MEKEKINWETHQKKQSGGRRLLGAHALVPGVSRTVASNHPTFINGLVPDSQRSISRKPPSPNKKPFTNPISVSLTRGYLPCRLPVRWLGGGPPLSVLHWSTSGSPLRNKEDSTRLDAQDKGSSKS